MRTADVTFVILTKNEAQRIESCLGSIPNEARVIVYDADSDDATRHIALRFGARVVSAPWAGFVAARSAAAALVDTPWTFMLDSDECLTQELKAELRALQPSSEVAGYSMPRRNIFCGRWIRGAGWWPDRLVRLFRTGRAVATGRRALGGAGLHEGWSLDGACAQLQSPIEHRSYESLAQYRQKFAMYTSLEAESWRPNFMAAMLQWLHLPLKTIWLLGPKLALRDGWRGAFIALASAAYPAVAATKGWLRRGAAGGRGAIGPS